MSWVCPDCVSNRLDERRAIVAKRLVEHNDRDMFRRFESDARRGFGFRNDDVGTKARHHTQRFVDAPDRGDRESQLREHGFRLSDDIRVAADDQHERCKPADVVRTPAAALPPSTIAGAPMLEYLCHRGKR